MARGWSLRLVAGLAAGAVVLSGCSQRQEAADTLPEADAPSSRPGLPPHGPPDLPMPAEARTQDAAGAEAFVRYYIDLINRTSTVMDAAPLREFSDGCLDCDRVASSTEKAATAGQDYEGGEITVIEVGEPFMQETTAEMTLKISQAKFIVLDSNGAAVDGGSEPYLQVPGGAALSWSSSRQSWMMTDLTFG